jgi:C-terminal processing protease CtpA/Prc
MAVNDILLSVNGISLKNKTRDEVLDIIKGPPGKQLHFVVWRNMLGSQSIDVIMTARD